MEENILMTLPRIESLPASLYPVSHRCKLGQQRRISSTIYKSVLKCSIVTLEIEQA
jgi:hypothetical protein